MLKRYCKLLEKELDYHLNNKTMHIGLAIKTLRREKGINQLQLCKMINISQTSLSSIETGKSYPSKQTQDAVLKALEVTKSKLMFLCIDTDDIKKDQREVFELLKQAIYKLLK